MKKMLIMVSNILFVAIIAVIVIGSYHVIASPLVRQEILSEGSALTPPPKSGIPKATEAEKAQAIEIAMNDLRLQELLEGKNYVIAPTGKTGPKIGVWHSGPRKLGVAFVIKFDDPHKVDFDFPNDEWINEELTSYEIKTFKYTGMLRELLICFDLYVGPRGWAGLPVYCHIPINNMGSNYITIIYRRI